MKAKDLPSISSVTLLKCLKGEANLATILKDHIALERENQFATQVMFLESTENDPEGLISLAKHGLKPAVLEWMLVAHNILNPPATWRAHGSI